MSDLPLKFLIDVGVGKQVEHYLQTQGYDIKTVRAIDNKMPDTDIIHLAVAENRMVITMDKDFGELVYHCGMAHSGVLLLRLEEATGTQKVQVIADILANYSTQIFHCFCVFQNDKLRIKKTTH